MPRVHVIIPARYQSSRLPGKPLALIAGKTMIQHVYERGASCEFVDGVTVATDDQRIADEVKKFGGSGELTSTEHQNGTSRIAEVAKSLSAEIIVNLQGDEPLIRGDEIEKVVVPLINDEKLEVTSLMTPIVDRSEFLNPSVVKVLVDRDGFAIYFSRFPLPFNMKLWNSQKAPIGEQWLNYLKELEGRAQIPSSNYYRHVGIYAFRRSTLLKYTTWEADIIEQSENLEQLRFLSNGLKIKMGITDKHGKGVDTAEDLEEVRRLMESL
ncbi:MAG: hypothetical protein A3F16_03835 [Deltaproteobacteria bacterium RIFCSPHIGHO2_12_FULL_43_9]|nr:MAG: hypothetical protein A3F16_03835 [Deltaproteobacteria bacterium RIFCSPHIGHO2_12_FULL_43_9]